MSLLKAMQNYKGQKELYLYWDIETLTYNKIEGRDKPSKYKNVTYSVAIGWNNNGTIDVEVFPSFKHFFDAFYTYAKRKDTITKSKTTIKMIAHNCNKYDNHFLLHDLKYIYPDILTENLSMKSAETNEDAVSIKEAKVTAKDENIILEKRVKSSNNLDLEFFIKGWCFIVIDNVMKTTTSIATLGKKLKDGGYLTDDQLKTDFDYQAFDVAGDMTDEQAYDYALQCFYSLTDEQMTYINNDVIILGQSHIHYSDIFPNFDYNAMTFSVNIMNSYIVNEKTRFQLLNKDKQKNIDISYTDYKFFDMNYYDFIKGFYRGGMNMYNDKYVAEIIDEPCFSIDINSSYPFVMYNEKIPYKLYDFEEYDIPTEIEIDVSNKDYFTLFKIDKTLFNFYVLKRIKSKVLKKMIVKYYNNDKDFVNINSNTIRMIKDLCHIKLDTLPVSCFVTFRCDYFGARDVIHNNYFIKTQGKLDKKIIMETPFDYTITDEVNETVYSQEEINLSKVVLNGLYGIPALRSHFNLFRKDENGELYSMINGYKNSERNILFSAFVTSQSLYNLLEPLQDLTQDEIDDNFIYCDTDSLYLKSAIKDKINSDLFDKISLGKWDVENERIEKMYVLNHKKYAYLKPNGKIHVASAGIPLQAFNTDLPFNDFIANEFYDGKTVLNNKSIYNEQRTITIYPSKTHIDKGQPYEEYYTEELEKARQDILKAVREDYDDTQADDILFIESHIGTFSFMDAFPVRHDIKNRNDLNLLHMIHSDL